jgi:hypothetical protein
MPLQLEDAEAGRTAAIKARQRDSAELGEQHALLEEACLARSYAEDRLLVLMKEKNSLQSLYDEQVFVLNPQIKSSKKFSNRRTNGRPY